MRANIATMPCRALSLALAFAVMTLGALPAQASRRYPRRYAARPLVLPSRVLRFDGQLAWMVRSSRDRVGLDLGLGLGVSQDLELGGLLLPVVLEPQTQYGQPFVYGLYRLARGGAQAGLLAGLWLPATGVATRLTLGPPLRVRVGSSVRVDLAALLDIGLGRGQGSGLRMPGALALQLGSSTFVGPEWELRFLEFERAQAGAGLLLGATLGEPKRVAGDVTFRLWAPDASSRLRAIDLRFGLNLFFDV
ncbi:MAG: hypothetical protein MJD61_18145 [Proteobacteria bacterium]|nr:hypothetical protein [Pseudomonadota bacterium]